MGSWLWLIIFPGLLAIIFFANFSAQRQLSKEIDANEKFDRPDDLQVAWHVQHNRQDIIYLCHLVLFGFFIVIMLLVSIANKLHVFD
jgi:hypothetical protein